MLYLNKAEQELVEKNSSCFLKILKGCLKVKNENILIITDHNKKVDNNMALMLAYGYYHAAKKKGWNVEMLVQGVKKGFMQAEPHIIDAIEKLPKKSILILSVSNKLGRFGEKRSFRKFCIEKGHRFISSTGLGNAKNDAFKFFVEVLSVNYRRLGKYGEKIKKQWDKAKEIRVKTEAGTDLIVNVEGMQARCNTGQFSKEGTGGNVPAGEVYIAPNGSYNVNGKVVLDGSIRHETGSTLLSEKLTLKIVDGKVVEMFGKEAQILENTFQKFENRAKYPGRIRLIGELGIGINPVAVLMGLAIMDEKVQGTAHIGIGSNYWFGGSIRTIFHGDMVFKNPKFFVDGKELKL